MLNILTKNKRKTVTKCEISLPHNKLIIKQITIRTRNTEEDYYYITEIKPVTKKAKSRRNLLF